MRSDLSETQGPFFLCVPSLPHLHQRLYDFNNGRLPFAGAQIGKVRFLAFM
jgi:hypothetical protein